MKKKGTNIISACKDDGDGRPVLPVCGSDTRIEATAGRAEGSNAKGRDLLHPRLYWGLEMVSSS